MLHLGHTIITVFLNSPQRVRSSDWFGPRYKLNIEFSGEGMVSKRGTYGEEALSALQGIKDACAFPSQGTVWIKMSLMDDQDALGLSEEPVNILCDENLLQIEAEGISAHHTARIGFFDRVSDNWILSRIPVREDNDGFWAELNTAGIGENSAAWEVKLCIQSDLQNQTWIRGRTYGEFIALLKALSGEWPGDWASRWNQRSTQVQRLLWPLLELGFSLGGLARDRERIKEAFTRQFGPRNREDLERWIDVLQEFAEKGGGDGFRLPEILDQDGTSLLRAWEIFVESGEPLKTSTMSFLGHLRDSMQGDIKNDNLASFVKSLAEQDADLKSLESLLSREILDRLHQRLPEIEREDHLVSLRPALELIAGILGQYKRLITQDRAYIQSLWTLLRMEVEKAYPEDRSEFPMRSDQILAEVSFTQAVTAVEASKIKIDSEAGAPFIEDGKLKIPLPLQPAKTYRIVIEPGAVASGDLSNIFSHSFSFTTGSFLRVLSTNPAKGAMGVPAELLLGHYGDIMAIFDSPLEGYDPTKITIDELDASGHWTRSSPVNLRLKNETFYFSLPSSRVPNLGEMVTVRLEKGAVRDKQSNVNDTFGFSFNLEELKAVSISPSPNEEDVPLNSRIIVTFNKPLRQGVGFGNIFLLGSPKPIREEQVLGAANVPSLCEVKGNQLIVKPVESLVKGCRYQLKIPRDALGIEGSAGVPLRDYLFSFYTSLPPSVKGISPSIVHLDQPIVVQLSKQIKKGSGAIFVFKGKDRLWNIDVEYGAEEIIVRPPQELGSACSHWGDIGDIWRETAYHMVIRKDAITDLRGNPMESSYSLSFHLKITPVSVVGSSLDRLQEGVQVSTRSIRILFDRLVQRSSRFNAIALKDEQEISVPIETSLVESGLETPKEPTTELLVRWETPLAENAHYALTIPPDAIRGCVPGIEFKSAFTLKFNTGFKLGPVMGVPVKMEGD